MSDTTIVNAMQTIIRATTLDGGLVFESDSVVIDDWNYRDETIEADPFCRIDSPTLLESAFSDSLSENTDRWQVRATLYKSFEDWHITRPLLRKMRTAVVDQFNTSNNRSLGALAATADVFVESIRDEVSDTFLYVYDRYIEPDQFEEILPVGIEIPMIFEIVEKC